MNNGSSGCAGTRDMYFFNAAAGHKIDLGIAGIGIESTLFLNNNVLVWYTRRTAPSCAIETSFRKRPKEARPYSSREFASKFDLRKKEKKATRKSACIQQCNMMLSSKQRTKSKSNWIEISCFLFLFAPKVYLTAFFDQQAIIIIQKTTLFSESFGGGGGRILPSTSQ